MSRRIRNAVDLATQLLEKVLSDGLDVSITIGNKEIPVTIHIKLPEDKELLENVE